MFMLKLPTLKFHEKKCSMHKNSLSICTLSEKYLPIREQFRGNAGIEYLTEFSQLLLVCGENLTLSTLKEVKNRIQAMNFCTTFPVNLVNKF